MSLLIVAGGRVTRESVRVVIIGCGFAGLRAARRLIRDKRIRLTVIDRTNHNLFQPLLYQVATAGLSPADISAPIRALLHDREKTEVVLASVTDIDLVRRIVTVDRGDQIPYDYLIVASGSRHSYFGKDHWEAYAPGLKTLEDAILIRRNLLLAFEEAEWTKDHAERDALLTFVVVGGGPTGVEMAGSIAELARFALARDFVNINPTLAKVILVEAGPAILRDFDETLSEKAERRLKDLKVHVIKGKSVTEVTRDGVRVQDEWIPTRNVIWAAGVKASELGGMLGAPLDRMGRVLVESDLSLPGHPEVFVVGDLAAVRQADDRWVPGMAPAAMQEGDHAARNIIRRMGGAPTEPFVYRDKGMMATIGRAAAVFQSGPLKISGFLAWFLWLVLHIFYLIGFRNRILVLIQWAWSYFTYKRGTRLIVGSAKRDERVALDASAK